MPQGSTSGENISWAEPNEVGRSEGLAERDIESLPMMGWGLMLAENSSTVVAAAVTGPPGGGKVNIWLNNSLFG